MTLTAYPPARNTLGLLYAMLAPIPGALLIGALLTDIMYSRSAEMMWADFSAWLVSSGVVLAYLAALLGLVALIASRGLRRRRFALLHALSVLVVLVVSTINMFVHTRDAWTSVVPLGLSLSAATTVLVIISALLGLSAARHPGFREVQA